MLYNEFLFLPKNNCYPIIKTKNLICNLNHKEKYVMPNDRNLKQTTKCSEKLKIRQRNNISSK